MTEPVNNSDSGKTLLDLAVHNEWPDALERAAEFPQEIFLQRPFDGLNVLHMACGSKNMTVDVLGRLFEIHSQNFERAAASTDARGMTPLLVACANRASLPIIQCLLEKTPSSAIQQTDKDGWSALSFLACWPLTAWRTSDGNAEAGGGNVSLRESFLPLSQTLLQIDPDMALKRNKTGYTPLHLLISTHQVELQYFFHCFGTSAALASDDENNLMDPRHRRSSLHDLWQIIQLFVTGKSDSDDNKNDSRILHQCLEIPSCPVLLVMLACRLHPKSLLQGDQDGNTPLHLAVKHSQTFLIPYLLNLQPEASNTINRHGETPFCMARSHSYKDKWHQKVHVPLLHAHPPVVHKAGMHPSVYAHVMERLLLEAKKKKDSREKAMTDLMASRLANAVTVSTGVEKDCSHTTVFEMIRSAPFLTA